MIALAADEIVMDENAVLGPVDLRWTVSCSLDTKDC